MLPPSPSQQLFHPNSFTVTPKLFPPFPPAQATTQTQTSPFPFPSCYDSSACSGTADWCGLGCRRVRWAPGGCNSPQPPPNPDNSPKMSLVPARRRCRRPVMFVGPGATFRPSGIGIRPPAVFSRPASRTADCGDQPGFGEFLVPPPPLFVGRTIFCAECGWRAPIHPLDGRPRPSPAPACYVALTRARLEHARVTKSSRCHNTQQNRLAGLVKR